MLAPLSWLKEYVEIRLAPKELGERLTEVGLGTEKITKVGNDTIFEFEITPNRPDLLSIVGIAREIAALEQKKVTLPKIKTDVTKSKPVKSLPLKITTDYDINPRFTGIIIDGITVKDSPAWLTERLITMGQRPINNIVDITNYVMLELGNPIHAFDYDKIKGKTMKVHQSKGQEAFKSVDNITYHLPKGAVVISDDEKIIDLCGIKGGYNSGTFKETKTIFLRVPVENPILIRRASQALGLRSEASSIFERGVNAGGTVEALKRASDLILQFSGGTVASKLYDLKKNDFLPWKLALRLNRLQKILGIQISKDNVQKILSNLFLSPKVVGENIIETTIPTFRNDLQIEEDLIEEVARMYGYNSFPKTMPRGGIPTITIPYYKDYRLEEKAKEILKASGYSEVYTYSLVSEDDLNNVGVNPEETLRVDNPVSREYEYLRPTLKINLVKALRQNKPYASSINLFELGKVYTGKTLDEAKEMYMLSGISNTKNFYEVKGILERLLEEMQAGEDLPKAIEVIEEGVFFEVNFDVLKEKTGKKVFVPPPKYPPITEDMAIATTENIKTGDIIEEIKRQSSLIARVDLFDQFEDTKTFHIVYQHKERNLSKEDVTPVRLKILQALKEKFGLQLKE